MPTYEYQCKSCTHRFEVTQKMADEPLTICPECGGTIRRLLFPAGIVFKGSGFYKTDHGTGTGAVLPKDEPDKPDEKKKSDGETPKTEKSSEPKAGGEKAPAATKPSEKVASAAD